MTETVNVTKVIDASSDDVWAAIGGIDGLDRWFPVIDSCKVEGDGVGAMRTMEVSGGGRIVDRIDEIDADARRFRYARLEFPLPVQRYMGTVLVQTAGDKTAVSWTIEMDVEPQDRDGVADFVKNAISDGISGLEAELRR
jgi:hypothetical protein